MVVAVGGGRRGREHVRGGGREGVDVPAGGGRGVGVKDGSVVRRSGSNGSHPSCSVLGGGSGRRRGVEEGVAVRRGRLFDAAVVRSPSCSCSCSASDDLGQAEHPPAVVSVQARLRRVDLVLKIAPSVRIPGHRLVRRLYGRSVEGRRSHRVGGVVPLGRGGERPRVGGVDVRVDLAGVEGEVGGCGLGGVGG